MYHIFCTFSPQQIKDAVALCGLFAWLEKEVFSLFYFCSRLVQIHKRAEQIPPVCTHRFPTGLLKENLNKAFKIF